MRGEGERGRPVYESNLPGIEERVKARRGKLRFGSVWFGEGIKKIVLGMLMKELFVCVNDVRNERYVPPVEWGCSRGYWVWGLGVGFGGAGY